MKWEYRQPERLIVNADDYGYSSAVNAAILELLQMNRISSTTVLANLAIEEDIKRVKGYSGKVGIHLNFIEGIPLCSHDQVRSITDENGNFLGSKVLLKKIFTGRIRFEEIKKEAQAQLNRLYDHGITPTHADSHQHTHIFPLMSATVLNVLAENNIYKVRYPFPSDTSTMRMRTLRYFCALSKRHFKNFSTPGMLYTDFSTTTEPEYVRVLNSLQNMESTSEWMCHPSKENDKSYLNKKSEYLFLKSEAWDHVLRASKVILIDYSQL